jgi:hypothetical protein
LIVSPESKLILHAGSEPHVQPAANLIFSVTENPVAVFRLQPFGFEDLDSFIDGLWFVRDGASDEQHKSA